MSNTKEPDLEPLIREFLVGLGEDPDRQGLQRTPARVVDAFRFFTKGYTQSLEQVVGQGVFEEHHEEMILVRDIELYSLCEHHLLPFYGRAHVAYIPDGRLLGLSKMPRLVEVFARRLQIQERLTDQIADAVMEVLKPQGVGVVVDAAHLCMMMRGVEKQNSRTVTSAVRGLFRTDARTRAEFLQLVHGNRSIE